MDKEKLIPIEQLCLHYEVEMSLFYELQEFEIIEIHSIEDSVFIHEDKVGMLEKVLRMQQDLNLNLEGVDAVLKLLNKIDNMESELRLLKNRLRLYEDND